MDKMFYDYLVAYNFSLDGCFTPCTGTIQVSRKNMIKTFDDLNELNKQIEDSIDGAKNVSVYNFILLGLNKH